MASSAYKPPREYLGFRKPMDAEAIERRLELGCSSIYMLAASAAGEQNSYTVDPLARRLRAELPQLIAKLADEVEASNLKKHGYG